MSDSSYSLQRCRFFRWTPSAINSISVTQDGRFAAVSRENSTVEVYDVKEDFICASYLPVSCGKTSVATIFRSTAGSVHVAVAGSAPTIEFYAVGDATPRSVPTHGGPAHMLVTTEDGALVAAACADESVRFFRVEEGGLVYAGAAAVGAPITALAASVGEFAHGLACERPGSDGAPCFVAAGAADGTVLAFDVGALATGEGTRVPTAFRFRASGGRKRPVAASAIAWLADGVVAVGDGAGSVHLFNLHAAASLITQMRQFTAPVLALAAGSGGCSLFATGVEATVALFARTAAREWVFVRRHTTHTHDVRAAAFLTADLYATSGVRGVHRRTATTTLRGTAAAAQRKIAREAGSETTVDAVARVHAGASASAAAAAAAAAAAGTAAAGTTAATPLLLTGGLDGSIVVWSVDEFAESRPAVRIQPFPALPGAGFAPAAAAHAVATAPDAGAVELWRLPTAAAATNADEAAALDDDVLAVPELALRLRSRSFGQVRALALSADARVLVVLGTAAARVYTLSAALDSATRVGSISGTFTAAKVAAFGTDYLVATGDAAGRVCVRRLVSDADAVEAADPLDAARLGQPLAQFALESGTGHVADVDVSDGAEFVLARGGSGAVVIFSLDACALLPAAQQPPLSRRAVAAAAFLPRHAAAAAGAGSCGVLLALSDNSVRVWAPGPGAWADWDRSSAVQPAWLPLRAPDHVRSVSFAADEPMALLAGTGFLAAVRLDRPAVAPAESLFAEASEATNFRRVVGLDRLLGAAFLADGSVAAAEVPPAALLSSLPPPAYRRRFGRG